MMRLNVLVNSFYRDQALRRLLRCLPPFEPLQFEFRTEIQVFLGLSKNISSFLSKQAQKVAGKELVTLLDRPLSEFLPEQFKNVLHTDITTPIKEKVGELSQKAKDALSPTEIIGKTKNYLSRKNVPENFNTSIDRLAEQSKTTPTGNVPKKNPLELYDEFYDQELKFKSDGKEDMAVNKVGERIGDAYETVIQQRRSVGQKMSEEIEKIADIKTDTSKSVAKFGEELRNNGLTYDKANKSLVPSASSKVTAQDRRLLEEYIDELGKLGVNPNARELDAFLSRIPNEIDVFKNTNNITKVTNGERIVKDSLRTLRSELSPDKNVAFADYFKARSDYAALSKFLDEGSKFVGRKSQSGDYVKDAGLAKSAIQSVHDNGRKDWLLKLEDLTGYKAIDEAILALQAGKDAGNVKAHSLLDMFLQKQPLPTSARSFGQRIIEKVIEESGEKFVGTPAEKTRRVIQERLRSGNTKVPSQFELRENNILRNAFDDLKNIPKGHVIERPFEIIDAPFTLSKEAQYILGSKSDKIKFTRRSLKHLAEKGEKGEKLFNEIPNIIKSPDEIRQGDTSDRFLISKTFKLNGGEPQTVILELTEQKGNIVITSFTTDKNYLSNFDLLWRAGTSI